MIEQIVIIFLKLQLETFSSLFLNILFLNSLLSISFSINDKLIISCALLNFLSEINISFILLIILLLKFINLLQRNI